MPALFAVAAAEAVLFIHTGEEIDVLRDCAVGGAQRQDTPLDYPGGGEYCGGVREIVLSVEAVLAQLRESADIWFEQADALVGGRRFSTRAADDPT